MKFYEFIAENETSFSNAKGISELIEKYKNNPGNGIIAAKSYLKRVKEGKGTTRGKLNAEEFIEYFKNKEKTIVKGSNVYTTNLPDFF